MTSIVVPEGTVLSAGAHEPNGTYCVMELVSVLAGGPWSDAPACVAPTLRRYCITINDRSPDDIRQRLLSYIPRLVGTAPELAAVEQRRSYLCADRAVRMFAPMALEARGMLDEASTLRAMPEIVDMRTAGSGRTAAYAACAYAACAYAASAAYDASAAYAASAAASAASAAYAAGAWDEAFKLLDDLLAIGDDHE